MKKSFLRTISILLTLLLTVGMAPEVRAYSTVPSLAGMIQNPQRRLFVEAMLSYHLRENTAVRETLEDGYSALFFFEGCSDNMEEPKYQDLAYYRITAVCIALKLDENGEPAITYFNDNCSTIPDRPKEIGAWELENVGQVGPATVCDGTYELYSVYHAGSYEALHMRTSYEDETAAAVYLTEDGFVTSQATYINIHTRTVNHALPEAMWSAGCLLVGYGNFSDFADLIAATYYSNYDTFRKGLRVGTVTINRQYLKEELYQLYDNDEAVDTLLVSSRCEDPQIYLDRCGGIFLYPEPKEVEAVRQTRIMSLPCSAYTDSRSIPVMTLSQGDRVEILGKIINTEGNLWYEVDLFNGSCYVYAGDAGLVQEAPKSWLERAAEFLLGK